MALIKRVDSFVTFGNSMVQYSGPIAPPEPPEENFLQLTNRGSNAVEIILDSATKGVIFIDDEFVSKFSPNVDTTITIPAGGVLKITGATPIHQESQPLLRDSTTGNLSLDRFDESITNYEFAFSDFKDLKTITSWNYADQIVSLKDAFNSTGLVSIPNSWNGLENVTSTDSAFSDCTNLVSGGISDFDSLSSLNNVSNMFYGDTSWTGDAYSLYEQFQNLGISPTNVFNNCTNSIGWNNIPSSWGG